jgi:hypothetical protein
MHRCDSDRARSRTCMTPMSLGVSPGSAGVAVEVCHFRYYRFSGPLSAAINEIAPHDESV